MDYITVAMSYAEQAELMKIKWALFALFIVMPIVGAVLIGLNQSPPKYNHDTDSE